MRPVLALFAAVALFAGRAPGDPPTLRPLPAADWDYAKARHLLARAGFGGGVYAAALEKWLGTPSEPVLGRKFPPADCVA